MPLRLLPFAITDGPANMAADEALLASAEAGRASLRFYGWTEATLSLGYFQPSGPARCRPALASLPWVRRPSGGAALVHHLEVTYALALPAGRDWQPAGLPWIGRMHEVLQIALADLDIATDLVGASAEQKLDDVLCFLHHTPGDLLLGKHKVAGSAQRKRHGALLQHGSVLLAQSPHTPELPGIAELAGRPVTPEAFIVAAARAFCRATGWGLEPGDWTEAERRDAGELVRTRYIAPRWNEKR
jgi:lipoate-protein ligase A